MKKILFFTALILTCIAADAQVLKAFTPRYSNPSVRGNIVYVSNSIISTNGVGIGSPGTGEAPPTGTSRNNSATGINIDIDNPSPTVILPFGSVWDYQAANAAPANNPAPTDWKQTAYTLTSTWNAGASPVAGPGKYGYSSGQVTCLPSGQTPICTPSGGAKFTSYYFRKNVSLTALELSGYTSIQANLLRNDGIVVYINGVERIRNNMPAGAVSYTTLATADIAVGAAEAVSVNLNKSFFTTGVNTIAVEVHLRANNSSNMSFDMSLTGIDNNGTFNSSSADLNLNSCSKVLFAGLYWGADQGTSGTDSTWITPAFNTIKLKIPGAATYQTLTSTQTNRHSLGYSTAGFNHTGYLCFKDITSLINVNNANGTYVAADVLGPVGINNACGGWTIVIAYSNPSLQPRNLTIFDGSVIINLGDPPVDVPISGFLTPPSGTVSCELGAVVYDGDRSSLDSFSFKQNGAASFYNLATTTIPLNGTQDAWNSKVSFKGAVVTTRSPAFANTLGYDASIFDLPNTSNSQLANNQTAATVRFSSANENYFVHVLSTSISQYNPTYAVSKSSTDLNGGTLRAGDSLRYQINYQNVGNDNSIQSTIIDNIPLGTTFIPGSLRISGVTKTDALSDDQADYDFVNNRVVFRLGTGATGTAGGNIGVGVSGMIQFDVVVSSSCSILNCLGDSIRNIARMNYVGLTSNSTLFDSSGVDISGCIMQGDVSNYTSGPCSVPSDTLMVNSCPATSVLIPWRRYSGYRIFRAQPFTSANLFDPAIPVTSSGVYWAYFTNTSGCEDTIRIRVFIIACPDIDDDNDGIPDYVELNNPVALQDANSNGIPNWNDASYAGFVDNNADGFNDNFDPSADADNDGIINFYDTNFPGYTDSNGDGVNDLMDKDKDGIPNHLDLDSDNDGIPDTVESYGVDQNGDGVIDNYSTSDNDGFSQNVDASSTGVPSSGNGLGAPDFDLDGVPNYLDTDSDNDGIPDIIEVLGNDTNNDGFVDGFVDNDADGLSDNIDSDQGNDGTAENTSVSLLRTGPDLNGDGRADNHPFKNMDFDRWPNCYDLDSDMDGIVDVIEAGFSDADFNGFVDGTRGTDGWNVALNAIASLNVRNSDGSSGPDFLDIDADDDGIPDNVEGQTTIGYKFPAYLDADNDGIDNAYDLSPYAAIVGGSGIFVADKDGDTIPDYLDLDTDSDSQPDIVEGNDFNLNGISDDDVALTFLDTDGDGLDNRFDSLNSVTNIRGTSFMMGTGGSLTGDPAPGTRAPVQKRIASQPERDWRYVSYVLPLQLLKFSGVLLSDKVNLNWSVSSPLPLDKFEIERSEDNIHFKKIALLDAPSAINEIKHFAAEDDISKSNSQVLFYRLKVIAKNGQEKYSELVVLRKGGSLMSFNIYPNPAKANAMINVQVNESQQGYLTIFDTDGKRVKTQTVRLTKGNNSISLDGLAVWPNGIYHVQVVTDKEVIKHKLIIYK
jgi:uncharacterized repeat protein (TIGR01451 family)